MGACDLRLVGLHERPSAHDVLAADHEPVDAVRLQLILLWVLLGSVTLAALIAVSLGYRGFFTPAHQLREPP